MKLFSLCVAFASSLLYPAASNDSPRTSLQSSLRTCSRPTPTLNDSHAPESVDLAPPIRGHARKRSKSDNTGIAATLNEALPAKTSLAASSSSWRASQIHLDHHFAGSHRKTEHLACTKEAAALAAIAAEDKWRRLRAAQFGKNHKRTSSLPEQKDREGTLYAMMELSEAYRGMVTKCGSSDDIHREAMRTQQEFKKDVSNIGYLVTLAETTPFEDYAKILAAHQRALDERAISIEKLLHRCELNAQRIAAIAEQQETLIKKITPPRKEVEKRSSKSLFHQFKSEPK